MNGVVLWHRITLSTAASGTSVLGSAAAAFGFGLPLTVSNSVYGLGLVLDADVTITAREGATATTFSVTLHDLPHRDRDLLRTAHAGDGLRIAVSLGYLDDPGVLVGDHPVLRGRVTAIEASVGDDGRAKVVLTGQEETGYALLRARASTDLAGHGALDTVVQALLDGVPASAGPVRLASGSTLGAQARDFTVRTGSVLAALSQLSEQAGAALVVGDGVVALGPAVGRETAPVQVRVGENVVRLGSAQTEGAARDAAAGGAAAAPGAGTGDAPEREVTEGRTVTVLGHPGLRVGQAVVTDLPDATGRLRISALTTTYSTRTGYVCELVLTDAAAGARGPAATPAGRVVDEFNRAIVAARQDHPAVDVGQATAYSPADGATQAEAHRVTLAYAQVPARGVTAPSTDSPVSTETQLARRPVASVFAFDKVGLVTPVYPGMRALLAHNRSLANDAVVAGWLWPSEPASAPPPNRAGDWWLALPTEIGGDGRPTGKGVNDLVDARGARVLQARALHVVVGADALPTVGTRPEVPADDTVTIEHASGTTIRIDAQGAVSITTDRQKITLGNGQVTLALDGTKVAVR